MKLSATVRHESLIFATNHCVDVAYWSGFSDAGNDWAIDALLRPASGKRQGTKSRSVMHPTVQRALWGFGFGVRREGVGRKRTLGSLCIKASVLV